MGFNDAKKLSASTQSTVELILPELDEPLGK